jgi:hypothetical protein
MAHGERQAHVYARRVPCGQDFMSREAVGMIFVNMAPSSAFDRRFEGLNRRLIDG